MQKVEDFGNAGMGEEYCKVYRTGVLSRSLLRGNDAPTYSVP